jgi:hypothetical protein
MKPLGPPTNNTIQSREETTSTCVMWDGPNISFDCLGVQICEGESINTIVYRSFVNLCTILEELNLEGLNLTCLGNLINTTRSINEVFNLLVDRLCIEADKVNQLEDIVTKFYTANLPFCLQEFNDQLTITKLPLPEYYQKVAAKICLYLSDIAILQNQYALSPGHYFYDQLQLLQAAIQATCNAAAQLVTPTCTSTNPGQQIDVATALENLEAVYCLFKNYTGSTSELVSAINRMCPDLTNTKRLTGTGLMSSIPGWILSPATLAESMQNLWLTICDLRYAVRKIEETCVSKDCLDANNDPLCCAKCAQVNDALGNGVTITYTTTAVHDLVIGDKINISGAMLPAGYNVTGVFITGVTPTTFTIAGTTTGVSTGISDVCSKIT